MVQIKTVKRMLGGSWFEGKGEISLEDGVVRFEYEVWDGDPEPSEQEVKNAAAIWLMDQGVDGYVETPLAFDELCCRHMGQSWTARRIRDVIAW